MPSLVQSNDDIFGFIKTFKLITVSHNQLHVISSMCPLNNIMSRIKPDITN